MFTFQDLNVGGISVSRHPCATAAVFAEVECTAEQHDYIVVTIYCIYVIYCLPALYAQACPLAMRRVP